MDFGRQWFGYKRSAVDAHIANQDSAITSLRLELERLKSAEPLLSAADEISSLLTSFAVAVSTTREQAERDAIATRRDAEEYAEGLKAETVRQCNDARANAAAEAEEMVRRAREEVETIQRAQERVEAALGDAARGIFSLMELLEHTRAEPAVDTPPPPPGLRVVPTPPPPPGVTPSPPAEPGTRPDIIVLPDSREPAPDVARGAAPDTTPDSERVAAPGTTPVPAPDVARGAAPDTTPDVERVAARDVTTDVAPGAGHPFEEVRVDPRDGMVVHFAPPPEPPPGPPQPWRPHRPDDATSEANAVTGEGKPEWHQPRHDGAGDPGPHDDAREQEPPAPWGS